MLARDEVARSFAPGTHASTFGGNPLACSVGLAVLQTLLKDRLLNNCVKMGKLLLDGLESIRRRFPFVRQVRGKGLIVGMELEQEGKRIVDECLKEGLLINCTAGKVLRFLPPLTVGEKEIDKGLSILEKVLARQ
jgi:acetylornithine/succinyldiaminopimelate/putrescine aminotransferase